MIQYIKADLQYVASQDPLPLVEESHGAHRQMEQRTRLPSNLRLIWFIDKNSLL